MADDTLTMPPKRKRRTATTRRPGKAPRQAAKPIPSLKAPLGSDLAPEITPPVTCNRVDVGQAIKFRINRGWSYNEIAAKQGVSKTAVINALKPIRSLTDLPISSERYNEHREMIIDGAMAKLLVHSVAEDKLKKSSTLQLMSAYGILFDKQRLIRGESTSNFDIRSQSVYLGREIERIKQELSDLPGESDATD